MARLVPPQLQTLEDGLDGVLVIRIGAVDQDVMLLGSVTKQTGVLEVADQGLDGGAARSRDGLEQLRLLVITDQSGDGGRRIRRAKDGLEDSSADVAGSAKEED